ncbi:Glycosyltransferase, GT2 family [Butyrivibrio fibrisolvens]|uniref:Glycosyltransferase, GT2 family n=1 Tax=Butyrivibrio fibrisolvens TaxID=831 RepID=A0A1H9WV32_BUTFI|nr:glycosyltransferase [Butyrivibrio fibrisolvens]SES37695.1 Glycosyltransferase, GT2 family [Butyrivibrio fibrisolvens]
MKLQSILLPQKNICDVEELYFHRDGEWLLFNGYFNLFYLEKHHKYCDIHELSLELECKGFRKLVVMHDDTCIHEEMIEGSRVLIKLPYDSFDKGVFWFKVLLSDRPLAGLNTDEGRANSLESLKTDDYWDIRGGFYGKKEVIEDKPRIKIGVNICTYKREPYVIRNMKSLMEWKERFTSEYNTEKNNVGKSDATNNNVSDSLVDSDTCNNAAANLHVFIIDNGQSLSDNNEFRELMDKYGVSRNMIEVIPNSNTGGSGGFGRGMVEAMNRRTELGLTHLLMMDDDAVFDPDMLVRLYGFLSFLKKEYALISVGGALFREDYKYIQHAQGEWFENFRIINDHPLVDMRLYENAAADWMTETSHEHDRYGAWWCCCYPMEVITRDNLPLPLFVHHDDIQFGMKLASENGVVFMNGINVWHQGFELAFTGVKQYYNTRNELITMKMFYPDTSAWSVKVHMIKRIVGQLICMRYGDIELIYLATRDYMKGIEWLKSIDVEALNKDITEIYKKHMPFKKIDDLGISEHHRIHLMKIADKYDRSISPLLIKGYYDHAKYQTGLLKKLTVNGWLLSATKRVCVVTPLDSPWKPFRSRHVILYQPADKKCAVMRRDYKWFWKSIKHCLWMIIGFDFKGPKWNC